MLAHWDHGPLFHEHKLALISFFSVFYVSAIFYYIDSFLRVLYRASIFWGVPDSVSYSVNFASYYLQ